MGLFDDVMKLRAIKDLSALRLCNPSALQLSSFSEFYMARH
jgi:hypothetical protein